MSSAPRNFEEPQITKAQRRIHERGDYPFSRCSHNTDSQVWSKPVSSQGAVKVSDDYATGNPVVSYSLAECAHLLESATISLKVPKIEVKPQYRDKIQIAWPRDLLHHVINSYNLRVNRENFPVLNSQTLNVEHYVMSKVSDSMLRLKSERLGNIKEAITFGSELPEMKLRTQLNVEYNEVNPLWLFALPTPAEGLPPEVSYHFNFRLAVMSLLRINLYKDGKWGPFNFESLTPDKERKLFNMLSYGGQTASNSEVVLLPKPRVTFNCRNYEERELSVFYCELQKRNGVIEGKLDRKDLGDRGLSVFFRGYHYQNQSNPVSNRVDEFYLDCPHPCSGFISLSRNVKAEHYHCYSNYTDNAHNAKHGRDPVQSLGLRDGNRILVTNRDPSELSDEQVPNAPPTKGYRIHSWASDLSMNATNCTEMVQGAKMSLRYANDSKNSYYSDTLAVTIREMRYVEINGVVQLFLQD